MRFCTKCGYQLEDDMQFCHKCGTKIIDNASSAKVVYPSVSKNHDHLSLPMKRKGMKALALICLVFAAIFMLIALANASLLAIASFLFIIGIMFFAISGTEKGNKIFYISNNKTRRSIKKSTFVTVCLIIAFVLSGLLLGTLSGNTSSISIDNPSSVNPTTSSESISISLGESVLTLNAGESHKLSYIIIPEGSHLKTLSWSSSNKSVAVVDNNGLVTALKHGETIITASDGIAIEAHCTINVPYIKPTAIFFSQSSRSVIYVESPLTVDLDEELTIEPQNADLENLLWTSSNEKIATVDNGIITGIKSGKVKITAETEDGLEAVKEYEVYTVAPESVSVKESTIELVLGETYQLNPIIKPKGAKTRYSYSGLNVDEKGLVTAKEVGTSTVAITTSNGKHTECTIVVRKKSPITILNLRYNIDYVGGVEWTFKIRNNTDREIKYVVLRWDCYNGVGDLITDEITSESSVDLRYTGPLAAHKTTTTRRNMTKFYNSTFKSLKFTEISVEYMDGTIEKVNGDEYVGWSD